MTNIDFEANELNHTHIKFYRETVQKCYIQRMSESTEPLTTIAQWAVEDAQALMNVMGYSNIGKLDTQVTHLPVRGETMKDIHAAMIQQAKDIIVKNATT